MLRREIKVICCKVQPTGFTKTLLKLTTSFENFKDYTTQTHPQRPTSATVAEKWKLKKISWPSDISRIKSSLFFQHVSFVNI